MHGVWTLQDTGRLSAESVQGESMHYICDDGLPGAGFRGGMNELAR